MDGFGEIRLGQANQRKISVEQWQRLVIRNHVNMVLHAGSTMTWLPFWHRYEVVRPLESSVTFCRHFPSLYNFHHSLSYASSIIAELNVFLTLLQSRTVVLFGEFSKDKHQV